MSPVERQNMIGRVGATTRLPYRHQMFEDLENLERPAAGARDDHHGAKIGYRVVAEGIETQDASDMLRSWGRDEEQGYLLSHPVAPSVTSAWRGQYVPA